MYIEFLGTEYKEEALLINAGGTMAMATPGSGYVCCKRRVAGY